MDVPVLTSSSPRLQGRVVVVAGGTGGVGEGVARAFLQAGAVAVVSARSGARLRALRRRLAPDGRLVTFAEADGDADGAERVREAVLDRFGGLDAVVDVLGSHWQGAPLAQVPAAAWRRVLDESLTASLVTAQAFFPAIAGREGSSYLVLAPYAGLAPYPFAGPTSVAAAARLMLARVLMEEQGGGPARVNALVHGPVLTRTWRTSPGGGAERGPGGDLGPEANFPARPRAQWLTADELGRFAVLLASPQGAVVSGETIRVLDRAQLYAWLGA